MALQFVQTWPQVFDLLHLALGVGVVLLLLLLLVSLRRNKTRASVAEQGGSNTTTPATSMLQQADQVGALQLLGILQTQARLVDFALEDIQHYGDDQVGVAARVVHQGLQTALNQHFTFTPVVTEGEGEGVTIESGFDTQRMQLIGEMSGQGPFKGQVVHQGWEVTSFELPQFSVNRKHAIIAPSQIEV